MGKLIDLDELKKFPIRRNHCDWKNVQKNHIEDFILGIESVLEYAENLPSAVTRCENCEHWSDDIPALSMPKGCGVCERWAEAENNSYFEPYADWYCADGEMIDDS